MNIHTAQEFIPEINFIIQKDNERAFVYQMMIEFAKLHVHAQTEAILARLDLRGEHSTIDKNIIANAYPFSNIK